ncbi:hypothetical protein [Methyloglobulus sp.]|uniref:hypothetical protein n=1 Tax=Methyloglobulus sp. TaxID=2518622 RepID=UPI0032B7B239
MNQAHDFSSEDATHWLYCQHCFGRGRIKYYRMPCVLLKQINDDRAKVLVFGDRYWAGRDHVKRVRYVGADR